MRLESIVTALALIPGKHARDNPVYRALESGLKALIRKDDESSIYLDAYGDVIFPYHKMGAIDTLDLFGLDELIIFSFYWANRHRYKKVADIGANLGLHTILMSKCGWSINSYEPDPQHADILKTNLTLNKSARVNFYESAVSDKDGILEFVRVLGNTTGSHLSGAKNSPYGELQKFPVKVSSMESVMSGVDFIKMDVYAHEAVILLSTKADQWRDTDMILEVGSEENAKAIFHHLNSLGVNMFSQKIGWNKVQSSVDLPTSYKDGSLFVTAKGEMPWFS